jgi:hypothetical protein
LEFGELLRAGKPHPRGGICFDQVIVDCLANNLTGISHVDAACRLSGQGNRM